MGCETPWNGQQWPEASHLWAELFPIDQSHPGRTDTEKRKTYHPQCDLGKNEKE